MDTVHLCLQKWNDRSGARFAAARVSRVSGTSKQCSSFTLPDVLTLFCIVCVKQFLDNALIWACYNGMASVAVAILSDPRLPASCVNQVNKVCFLHVSLLWGGVTNIHILVPLFSLFCAHAGWMDSVAVGLFERNARARARLAA